MELDFFLQKPELPIFVTNVRINISSSQGLKDSGIGSQGITNSIDMMTKIKSMVINLPTPTYSMG